MSRSVGVYIDILDKCILIRLEDSGTVSVFVFLSSALLCAVACVPLVVCF